MPEAIEVKVSLPAGDYYFPVKIIKFEGGNMLFYINLIIITFIALLGTKLYLGGYRNKLNGKVYHHSSSQTPTESKKKQRDVSNLRTRETQTTATRTCAQQTTREAGTQMERVDLIMIDSKKRDVVKFSNKRYIGG